MAGDGLRAGGHAEGPASTSTLTSTLAPAPAASSPHRLPRLLPRRTAATIRTPQHMLLACSRCCCHVVHSGRPPLQRLLDLDGRAVPLAGRAWPCSTLHHDARGAIVLIVQYWDSTDSGRAWPVQGCRTVGTLLRGSALHQDSSATQTCAAWGAPPSHRTPSHPAAESWVHPMTRPSPLRRAQTHPPTRTSSAPPTACCCSCGWRRVRLRGPCVPRHPEARASVPTWIAALPATPSRLDGASSSSLMRLITALAHRSIDSCARGGPPRAAAAAAPPALQATGNISAVGSSGRALGPSCHILLTLQQCSGVSSSSGVSAWPAPHPGGAASAAAVVASIIRPPPDPSGWSSAHPSCPTQRYPHPRQLICPICLSPFHARAYERRLHGQKN
jgi:hypothetical protein